MPLHWTIDRSKRRVAATLLATTNEQEMYGFFGEVIAHGAMPYAKIFDATNATRWIRQTGLVPLRQPPGFTAGWSWGHWPSSLLVSE
jgi:hypothetical protein